MKLHLMKEKDGKFSFKKTFEDKEDSLATWEIPENMMFDSGRFPSDIRSLIRMQEMSIQQGETAIRRIPLREEILKKLIEIKRDEE